VVVDDDAYHALWFDVPPPASIGTLDEDRVVSLGSCSKVLAPGLRVGWMCAPRWLREVLVRVKQACDLHTSSVTQAIALDVLADEAFMGAHLDGLRAAYVSKARVLERALAGCGEGWSSRGGMFLWRHFDGVDADGLLASAIAQRVAFVPGSAFAVDQSWRTYARLSFATLDDATLVSAAATLRELVA
jgi:2-aminoadipate transaminase